MDEKEKYQDGTAEDKTKLEIILDTNYHTLEHFRDLLIRMWRLMDKLSSEPSSEDDLKKTSEPGDLLMKYENMSESYRMKVNDLERVTTQLEQII